MPSCPVFGPLLFFSAEKKRSAPGWRRRRGFGANQVSTVFLLDAPPQSGNPGAVWYKLDLLQRPHPLARWLGACRNAVLWIQTCCPPFSFRCRSPGVRRVRASPGAVRGRCPVRTLGRRGKHQAAACSPSLLHYSLLPLTSTWLPRRGSQGKSTTESPFGFAIVPPSVPFGDSSPSRGGARRRCRAPARRGYPGGRRPLEIRPEGELN